MRGASTKRIGMSYTLEEHKHRFAAWAAGLAASVKGCRFSVERGKIILETSGLRNVASSTAHLPEPTETDDVHLQWRNAVINAARENAAAQRSQRWPRAAYCLVLLRGFAPSREIVHR